MIVFLLLFIGLPIALTLVYGDEERTIAYWMPMTMLILFFIWTVVSLPCVLLQTKFHVPLYIFIALVVLLIAFLIYKLIRNYKNIKERYRGTIKAKLKELFCNKFFIIMMLLVLFQVGRVTIFQPFDYRDSKTYNALVNDIVETDSFYTISDSSGSLVADVSNVSTKYRLSTWYSFEAVLSVIFFMKPLTVLNTILPGYLIIIAYMVLWKLGWGFLKNNITYDSIFVSIIALIYELFGTDITNIFLTWPTWGKNIITVLVVPFVIYEWLRALDFYKNHNRFKSVGLVVLVSVGCAASNMGFMIMPIEITFLTIAEFICRKKIQIDILLRYFLLLVPVVIYTIIYVLVKMGLL